jgi:hypothetical protein
MRQVSRYVASFLGTALLWAAASYADYYRQLHIPCGDCFFELGLPFKFWMEGGFTGTRLFMPVGLSADIAVVLILAAALGGHGDASFQSSPLPEFRLKRLP